MGLCWLAGRHDIDRRAYSQLVSTVTGTNTHYWRNPSATAKVYDRGVTTGNGTGSARREFASQTECSWSVPWRWEWQCRWDWGIGEWGWGMAMRSWIMD
jgi:hypothetical protein